MVKKIRGKEMPADIMLRCFFLIKLSRPHIPSTIHKIAMLSFFFFNFCTVPCGFLKMVTCAMFA